MSDQNAFELGFCLGGAVSAGAYQAGVIDFLIEALDAWEEAKKAGLSEVPRHQVKIKVIGGTSGGGICAGLWAVHSGWKFEHFRDGTPPARGRNPFYDAWVRDIDMSRLLQTEDLKDKNFSSFLDCTVLDEISVSAFTRPMEAAPVFRNYFADPIHLFLTNTNLRGVPYRIRMQGSGGTAGNDLRLHADYLRFAVGKEPLTKPGITWFNPRESDSCIAARDKLTQAALATSAFPFALAPRMVDQEMGTYGERTWFAPAENPSASGAAWEPINIAPAWKDATRDSIVKDGAFKYWAADGGVLNNEPLELVRQFLAGGPHLRNPRDPVNAHRMTILLDPFVAEIDEAEAHWVGKHTELKETEPFGSRDLPPNLLDQIIGLVGCLRHQANFKPQELALAYAEDVYSRFLIAPVRVDEEGNEVYYTKAIACGLLGGFGGFLDQALREHDYLLGRYNCRQFLERSFALEIAQGAVNPRFGLSDEAALGSPFKFEEDGRTYLPLIPLVGSAKDLIDPPPWPKFSRKRLDDLLPLLKERLNQLAPLMKTQTKHELLGVIMAKALDWGDDFIKNNVEMAVRKAIVAHDIKIEN